ncbi:MAG: dUTP diphosphatase [Treponemataceae bacterium]
MILPVKVFTLLKDGAKLPEYKTEGAAGADIFSCLEAPIVLKPMERKLIPTGIAVQLPEGYELQLRPRSGLALKHGITVLNSPGTIDSDYRGELLALLINFGEKDFTVENGERIAQVVLAKVERADFISSDKLDKTLRGSGGYGSTGIT